MNACNALLFKLMQQYDQSAYRLTLLEIQKLAYFLQEAGQPLQLQYDSGFYGPYAPNLNKVLEILEGHFIRGYGDSQKPDVEITLLEGAEKEAEVFLEGQDPELQRLERVSNLINGFETPYGMELLSSVHWLAKHSSTQVTTPEEAINGMAAWNDRKRRLFKPEHIRVAWNHLTEQEWFSMAAAS